MRRIVPLTAIGLPVLLLGTVAYIAGWQLGWIELMVVAAGCAFALAIGIPFIIGRLALDMERVLEPARVTVGDRAVATLRITNPRRSPTSGRRIEEVLTPQASAGQATSEPRRLALDVPSLGPHRSTEAVFSLPTGRRGVVDVGPTVIVKADPLGLFRREVAQTKLDTLWVHPRVAALTSLPVGFAKDLEGPTSDTSPAGDVAFHALREYQMGDDYRHIHWMSSARTGTLMVRHYVDNRRPVVSAIVDNVLSSYASIDQFEIAVEVEASLIVSSMLAEQPITARIGDEVMISDRLPRTRDGVLDALSLVGTRDDGDLTSSALQVMNAEPTTSALVLITGGRPITDFLQVHQLVRRSARLIVVRVWPEGQAQPAVLSGATVHDVDSLTQFQLRWNAEFRR